jgi:hypothetical protein
MSSRPWSGPIGLALILVLSYGCASSGGTTPEADPLPEEAPAEEIPEEPVQPAFEQEPSETAVEPAAEETAAEIEAKTEEEASGAYGPKTVVVAGPEKQSDAQPQTLAEAARQARERRGAEAEPIAVITDETLSEFATGELTVASEPAARTPPPSEGSLTDLAAQETYWRTRVRDARVDWRDLVEEVAELEGEVAKLRTRFYAEDDGFFRDSQIKPAWDRALDRLSETQAAVVLAQEDLQLVLQEGRQAGALPGWLREGMEYEPTAEETGTGFRTHEPGEPEIVDEDGGP